MSEEIEREIYDAAALSSKKFEIKLLKVEGVDHSMLDGLLETPDEMLSDVLNKTNTGSLNSSRASAYLGDAQLGEIKIEFSLEINLHYGGQSLLNTLSTRKKFAPIWGEWIRTNRSISDLPRETRLCLILVAHKTQDKNQVKHVLAWTNMNVFDHQQVLRTGEFRRRMWVTKKPEPLGTTAQDIKSNVILHLEFDSTPCPVVFLDE